MEPISTTTAIGAVVGYLAKKLKDNQSVSDFFNDFADATVAWLKPVFLTDDGKENRALKKLQEDPNSTTKQEALKGIITSEIEDQPEAEKHLQEMAQVIRSKEPQMFVQNTVTITGNNNKVFQGVNNSQITDNSIIQNHSGTGDNVAGNKIGTQNAEKIYNIDKIDKADFS
jgi:hypothetical protein